jgi:hypothetical protein
MAPAIQRSCVSRTCVRYAVSGSAPLARSQPSSQNRTSPNVPSGTHPALNPEVETSFGAELTAGFVDGVSGRG